MKIIITNEATGGLSLRASALDYLLTPIATSTAEGSTPGTFYDSKTLTNAAASVWNEYELTVAFESGIVISNESPSVIGISGKRISKVRSGVGFVRLSYEGNSTLVSCDVTATGGQTFTVFDGYSTGSVSEKLANSIKSLMDSGGDLNLFSTYSHSTPSYIRNSGCWIDPVKFSGLAVALATNGTNWTQGNAPVLISSQHGLIVRHWQTCIKGVSKVRCLGTDGVIYERTIVGISAPIQTGALNDDLIAVTFNSPFPAAVVPFKIAGEWLRQAVADSGSVSQFPGSFYAGGYAVSINQNYRAGAMTLGQQRSLAPSYVLRGITYNGSGMTDIVGSMAMSNGTESGYSGFASAIASGDSGKPTFVFVAGYPVLVALFTYPNLGPFTGAQNGALANALIVNADASAGVSTGKTVTIASSP